MSLDKLFEKVVECGNKDYNVFVRYCKSGINEITLDQLKKDYAIPDPRPGWFDVTFEAWFHRLKSMWGNITITYNDPDKWGKRKISEKEFLKIISEPSLGKILGKWEIESPTITKVIFYREYPTIKGKIKKQKLIVDIDLSPELKKVLK